jgi:hypothetical protein
MTALFMLVSGAFALADEVDDSLTTGQTSISLGSVPASSTHTRSVTLYLEYSNAGGGHAAVGQVVKARTASTATGVSSATWTFTVPSGWGTSVTSISGTQSVDVTVGSTAGQRTLKVDCIEEGWVEL